MARADRRRIVYHGRVQGVGFRATVQGIAARHPVAGYVRNLPDGTVELVIEGPAEAIDAVLADVGGRFAGRINRAEARAADEGGPYAGFAIRT